MADYIEPTQEQFSNSETVLMDALTAKSPSAVTKTGSVIRELIIRPAAYLYSWLSANVQMLRTQGSVAYLKASSATENELADAVASNYFITRNEGAYAKGQITLTVNSPFGRISSGNMFSVGGYTMYLEKTCILTSTDVSEDTDDTMYIKMMTVIEEGGAVKYIANIPVRAADAGKIELPEGTEVEVLFANSFVTAAELTSAITGGSTTETDAEMMQRCEYNTAASGIGSYNGIRKKLVSAPVTVTGLAVVAGEDDPIFRARYNNTNINPGGYVDVYVRTQSQESVKAVDIALTTPTVDPVTSLYVYSFSIPATACPGFYGVRRLLTSRGAVTSYTVAFGTDDASMTADSARLSCHQTATITFSSLYNDETAATVYLACMPDIDIVDTYMGSDENRFIGQDVCVKAAVPVTVQLTASVQCQDVLEESELTVLKEAVAEYINDLAVGTASINFSDIRRICSSALPKAELKLPCTMSASVYLTDGTIDHWYSNTGILRIAEPVSSGYWSYKLSFFSTTPDLIRIEQE